MGRDVVRGVVKRQGKARQGKLKWYFGSSIR